MGYVDDLDTARRFAADAENNVLESGAPKIQVALVEAILAVAYSNIARIEEDG